MKNKYTPQNHSEAKYIFLPPPPIPYSCFAHKNEQQLDGDSSTQSTSKKKVKEDEQGNGVITEAIKKRSEEYLNGILKEVVASSKKSRR